MIPSDKIKIDMQAMDFELPQQTQDTQFQNLLKDYLIQFKMEKAAIVQRLHGFGCKAVTGYAIEEFNRNPALFDKLIHSKDRKRVMAQIEKVAQGRSPLPFEFQLIRKSGEIRWIQCYLSREAETKEGLRVSALWQDISDLKTAEQGIQASEGKYQSLINDVLEDTHTAMMILDKEFTVVWINKAFETFFNISRQKLLQQNAGRIILEYIQPQMKNPERFSRKVLDAYNNNTYAETFECTIKASKATTERWLIHRSEPIRHGLYTGGRVEQYTDITEQKRIIEDIVESQQRYKQLLDHLTDYIYTVKVTNGKPGNTFHGPGCISVTGYSQDDFDKNPALWIQMVHEADRDMVREQVEHTLAGQQTEPLEHRIIHRNGTMRWVKSTIVLRQNENGHLVSYDGLVTDITELKETESLAKSQEQQLIQADKMATLGILVAGVAHEINNPNNFILLNSKMIKKAWHDVQAVLQDYYHNNGDFAVAGMLYSQSHEKISDLIEGLVKGSLRIQKIVQSLKGFARQDTGDLTQPVQINEVVDAAIEIVRNLIKKSTHHFTMELDKTLPPIRGNFQKLEQVVINLITNACQALESPQKALLIKTGLSEDLSHVVITVQDEGGGISEEDLKHIIDPFFTTKRERGGTGLGLSIAYNIIQDHGGNLYFDSSPNKGTTVEIYLPVVTQEQT